MAGVFEFDDRAIAEVLDAAVALGIAGPRIRTVQEQRGAGDRLPQLVLALGRDILGVIDVDVRVELPGESAILVAVDAVDREVPGLDVSEVGVFGLHARVGVF